MAKYKLSGDGVQDTETGAFIPVDADNRHWRMYQDWLAAGNSPDPEFTPEEIAAQAILDEVSALHGELKNTLHWLFRMILEVWDVGAAKGLWTGADITDDDLKTKVAEWRTKLDRLKTLGE